MLETFPFEVAESILVKLGSSALQQIALICGVKDELRKLCNTLTIIRAALLDADEQQEKSHLVQNWIKNLKDVVYDADDSLDEFSTYTEPQRMRNQVSQFFSSSNQLAFRYKMGNKIRKIRERLDEVASDMFKFNFSERYVVCNEQGKKEREPTHSYVIPSNVIGREGDKEEIVTFLMHKSDEQNVSAIAIVGMGGLGKTTLAKLVYNDNRVIENFDSRMWVSVHDEFSLKLLMERILASGSPVSDEDIETGADRHAISLSGKPEMEQLQILVRRKLNGKKYLMVLDDVWNDNREKWIQLSELLIGGAQGSKIVVTTRSQEVAIAIDTDVMLMLEGLPEDASWSLFKLLAFKKGKEEHHPKLVEVGKRIVKKCHGLPLAIRTLGSMLSSKPEEREWLSVENNEIWELPNASNDILGILKLSYDNLPSYLKQCFAYCSLFPKGHEFQTKTMIQVWMAQGYISVLGNGQELEDVGYQYFEELLMRSFFQDVKRDDINNIISCKMHDLLHDLAYSVAKPECCIAEAARGDISERVRHVSFSSYLPWKWSPPRSLLKVEKLRTFLLPLQTHQGCRIADHVVNADFRHLRVLDLHNQRIYNLPKAIGQMIHLRYLDLSNNMLTTLPRAISKLKNLQTLKLARCYKLREFPNDFKYMVSLRHLETYKCSMLTHMPRGLGQLTGLQTLQSFIIGRRSSTPTCGGLDELNGLNDLRGELCIVNLQNVQNETEGKLASMKDKKNLFSLKLNWSREANDGSATDARILEGLLPHRNLKELHLSGYGDVKFATWMSTGILHFLPNLVVITIERLSKCKQLPALGQLPSLRVLKLYCLDVLECISDETSSSSYFPSLTELMFFDLPLLSEWPSNTPSHVSEGQPELHQHLSLHGKRFFPSLTKLTIIDCPRLGSLPFCPELEKLVMHNTAADLLGSLFVPMQQNLLASTNCNL